MKLSSQKILVTEGDFSPEMITYMWSLCQENFPPMKAHFLESMENSNFFALYLIDDYLVGFTGLSIHHNHLHGKNGLLIHFGQTVIDKPEKYGPFLPLLGRKLCQLFFWDLLRSKVSFSADPPFSTEFTYWKKEEGSPPTLIPVNLRNIKGVLRHILSPFDEINKNKLATQTDRPSVSPIHSPPITILQ